MVNRVEEKGPEKTNPEKLPLILKNVFIQDMGMDEMRIEKLHRMGSLDSRRKFPRPIFIQLFGVCLSKVTGKIHTTECNCVAG